MIKTEEVGYLKSSLNVQNASLSLVEDRLTLEAQKTGIGGLGILGALFKQQVETSNFIFDFKLSEIAAVTQGQHGVQRNVLEITGQHGKVYRLIVKEVEEWLALLL